MPFNNLLEIVVRAIDEASGVFRNIARNALMLAKTIRSANRQIGDLGAAPIQSLALMESAMHRFGDTAISVNARVGASSRQLGESYRLVSALLSAYLQKISRNILTYSKDVKRSNSLVVASNRSLITSYDMLSAAINRAILNALSKYPPFGAVVIRTNNAMIASMNQLSNGFGNTFNSTRPQLNGFKQTLSDTGPIIDTTVIKSRTLNDTFMNTGEAVKRNNSIFASFKRGMDSTTKSTNAFSLGISKHFIGGLSKGMNAMSSFTRSATGLRWVLASMFSGIAVKKMYDWTVGLAITREKLTQLVRGFYDNKKAADAFMDTMDKLTYDSITDLDSLVKAMVNIKKETGMTNKELENTVTTVNMLGQYAILMGRTGMDTVRVMQAYGKGLNGDFQMLTRNFGISKKLLMSMGWSGASTDVEGYNKAIEKVLERTGNLNGLMAVTFGKLETLKKYLRVAGRDIGMEILPKMSKVLNVLIDLVKNHKGLTKAGFGLVTALSGLITISPFFNPMLDNLKKVRNGFKAVDSSLGVFKKNTTSSLKHVGSMVEWLSTNSERGFTRTRKATVLLNLEAYKLGKAVKSGHKPFQQLSEVLGFNVLKVVGLTAALAVLGYAFYRVGQNLGYWKDFPSMLEAIGAGIKRIFNAIINDKDVQAFFNGIKSAIEGVTGAIDDLAQPAKNARDHFDAIGWSIRNLGPVIKGIIMFFVAYKLAMIGIWAVQNPYMAAVLLLIGILIILYFKWEAFHDAVNNTASAIQKYVIPALIWLADKLGIIDDFGKFLLFISGPFGMGLVVIAAYVYNLKSAFEAFVSYISGPLRDAWNFMNDLPKNTLDSLGNLTLYIDGAFMAAWDVLSGLPNKIWTYLTSVINTVKTFFVMIVSLARVKIREFIDKIVTTIQQLPGKFRQFLESVVNVIRSKFSEMISTASSRAREIVDAVISYVSTLPDKVYEWFARVPGAIRNALGDAINAAISFGRGILDSAISAITGGAFAGPENVLEESFMAAAGPTGTNIGNLLGDSIITGLNTTLNRENLLNDLMNLTHGKYANEGNPNPVTANININHDFMNLPDNIDEETLREMLMEMANDPEFNRSLTSSLHFQVNDVNMKQRITYRNNRSLGI